MISERNRLPSDASVVRSDKDGAFFRNLTTFCNDYPLLSAEEEQALGARIQGGDRDVAQDAARTLVLHNLRLVVYLARKYAGRSISLSELVDEGTLGLMEAAKRFEPQRGVRFATYAGFYIEMCCRRATQRATQTIRIPAGVVALRSKVNRYSAEYMTEHGVAPSIATLARVFNVQPGTLRTALSAQSTAISLESLDHWDNTAGDDDTPIIERLVDHSAPLDDAALDHIEADALYDTLRRLLTQRELVVIAYLYRLGDAHVPYSDTWDDDMTYEELGMRLHVSRETVRLAKESALAKLRQAYGVSFERTLASKQAYDE